MLLCLALAAGCAKQGEGERCDQNNGNLDCESGLVCKGESQLSITGPRGTALCCPASNGPNTVDACRAAPTLTPETPAADAGSPSPAPEPVTDAGADATTAP